VLSAGGFSPENFNRSTVIFYFFCAVGKNYFIDNQRLRKYFKNNCSNTCVYHIHDVYLYHQLKQEQKWNTQQNKSKTQKETITQCWF
jgi:hypothetical protein